MESNSTSDNSRQHLRTLKRVLTSLHQVYLGAGRESDFLFLLRRLGADETMQAGALELVRYFNPSKRRFKIPQHRVMEMLGKSLLLDLEIKEAVNGFRNKRKGPAGGLKRFHKEFKREYEDRSDTLREYKHLKASKRKLEHEETKWLEDLEDVIPKDIKKKINSTGVKTLAADWMRENLPCTKSTLLQIIRYKPERRRGMKSSNKKHR